MKKFISIICVLLSLSLLCSCKDKKTESDYDHAADFTEADGEIYKSVPTERYEDYIFRILNAKTDSDASFMDTDTVTGENLNEALYRRNTNVEERLGITIEERRDTPDVIFDTAVTSCLAGEDTYSAVCNTSEHMATMAVCGYLVTDEHLFAFSPSW